MAMRTGVTWSTVVQVDVTIIIIIIIIIIMIYSHQEMHIKSTNISISSADNKGQLRTTSLTNNNSAYQPQSAYRHPQ